MKRYAVIVAGGKGLRMKNQIPKQFLCVNGLPILMHTINRFKSFDPEIRVIVVLPKDQISYWKELCKKHGFTTEHETTEGGATRFLSVRNGLSMVEDGTVVGIHDGVRPFVSDETLKKTYETAERCGSAIPAVAMVDSVRRIDGDGLSHAEDRSKLKLVQTPQTFRTDLLKEAFRKAMEADDKTMESFTDDASVYEYAGNKVELVEGDRDNIKITSPGDLEIASLIAKRHEE